MGIILPTSQVGSLRPAEVKPQLGETQKDGWVGGGQEIPDPLESGYKNLQGGSSLTSWHLTVPGPDTPREPSGKLQPHSGFQS